MPSTSPVKQTFDHIVVGGGSAGCVVAARLGVPVAFVGSVGDDPEADEILSGLIAEGIDISGVARISGSRSASSVVIVDASQASRAIINRPPDPIRLDQRARELLGAADWVHVDQAGWAAVHEWWRTALERPSLSVDAGNPIEGFTPADVELHECLRYANHAAFCSCQGIDGRSAIPTHAEVMSTLDPTPAS